MVNTYELQPTNRDSFYGKAMVTDVQSMEIEGKDGYKTYAENRATLFSYGTAVVTKDNSEYFKDSVNSDHSSVYILHIDPESSQYSNTTARHIKEFTGLGKDDFRKGIANGSILQMTYGEYEKAVNEHLCELVDEQRLSQMQTFGKSDVNVEKNVQKGQGR